MRAKGLCERCGRRPPHVLHAHHIVGRRNHRVRWELRNGVSICYRDHRWAHEEPLEFADWIREIRPDDVAYVEKIKNQVANFTDADLIDMRETLQKANGA